VALIGHSAVATSSFTTTDRFTAISKASGIASGIA
jgi:hypothetical protein